jgi:hypothetical protein
MLKEPKELSYWSAGNVSGGMIRLLAGLLAFIVLVPALLRLLGT